jgi:RNA polymerase sigma-70 factor (ECF subfamily)
VQELDDAELARRVTGGTPTESAAAEAELAQRFAPRIRLFGLRRLRDSAGAEDLVQEVLMTTLKALRTGRLQQADRLASFVLGTCRMTIANQRRGERRRAQLMVEFGHDLEPVPEPAVDSMLDRDRLADCLGRLSARDRAIVALTFYAERSADQIARELGTTSGNVRVLRHRALSRLQDCLEGAP